MAQAFSTRVARLKRRSGEACSTSEAVKSCAEKPALKWPSTISSTSPAAMPASASASPATRTIRLSTRLAVEAAERRYGPIRRCRQSRRSPVIPLRDPFSSECGETQHPGALWSQAAELWTFSLNTNGILSARALTRGLLAFAFRPIFGLDSDSLWLWNVRSRGPTNQADPEPCCCRLDPSVSPDPDVGGHRLRRNRADGVARASAEALLVIEVETGKVLYAENATYPWYPASVTKLMTAYAVAARGQGRPAHARHRCCRSRSQRGRAAAGQDGLSARHRWSPSTTRSRC